MRACRLMLIGIASFTGFVPLAAPATNVESCRTRTRALVIDLDNRRHARILDHAWDAIRVGKSKFLHIDREHARAHRRASLRGIPVRTGYDRDEYPPAASEEGGAGADIRYVKSAENRSAGNLMGRQLRGWCNGQRFRFENPWRLRTVQVPGRGLADQRNGPGGVSGPFWGGSLGECDVVSLATLSNLRRVRGLYTRL